MKDKAIVYKQNYFLPIGARLFSLLVFVPAINYFLNGTPEGFVLGSVAVALGMLMFSTKGVEINREQQYVRAYVRVYGIKTGKRVPLSTYSCITVIAQGYRKETNLNYTSPVVQSSFMKYNLLLLNDTHHKKLVLYSYDDAEKAIAEAKKLELQLGFRHVKYDPVRTRGRKK